MDNKKQIILGIWIGASILLPAIWLISLGSVTRDQRGLPLAPFCSRPLLIVHLISALPLSLFLGGRLCLLSSRSAIAVSLAMALGAIGATLVCGSSHAATGWFHEMGFLERILLRTMLSLMFITPILTLARNRGEIDVLRLPALVGLLVALLVPGALAYRQSETRLQEASKNLESGRLAKALHAVEFLVELGSRRSLNGQSPAVLAQSLGVEIERLKQEQARGLSKGSSQPSRLNLAFVSLQLDDHAEAERLLAVDVQAGNPDSMLLLAAALRDQDRTLECEQIYRRILQQFRSKIANDRQAREACDTAYEGLVDLLKAAGRSTEASRLLVEARATIPGRVAYYTLRLGAHSLDMGRPVEALNWLNEAVRLDSRLVNQARPLIRQAKVKTPACLIAR